MPANLSPEFKQAEERFRAAKTPEERLMCLEEMLTAIPKHKGTEKMQADLKSRIAATRKELSSSGKSGAKRGDWFHVERQGAGQVALCGAPNTGKSALVRTLTGLQTHVAAYPFTTTAPAAGMMPFEDIQVQLVDTPPVSADTPAWVYHILRTANMILWVIDLADDGLVESTEETRRLLEAARISVVPHAELRHQLTIVVGNKCDDPGAADRLAILAEFMPGIDILPVSAETGAGLEELKRRVFKLLDIIRVYTKKPGKPPVMLDPVILKTGSTVMDAAYHLHKEIAASMQFARLWHGAGHDPFPSSEMGSCPKPPSPDGQRVERGHILQDQDIVEFHT